MNINEIYDLARQKYPSIPAGYFEGEIVDGNEDARFAYVHGFEDGIKYAMEKLKEAHDND